MDDEVVESAVCCHDERAADALVLRDPGTQNAVVVNQADICRWGEKEGPLGTDGAHFVCFPLFYDTLHGELFWLEV